MYDCTFYVALADLGNDALDYREGLPMPTGSFDSAISIRQAEGNHSLGILRNANQKL